MSTCTFLFAVPAYPGTEEGRRPAAGSEQTQENRLRRSQESYGRPPGEQLIIPRYERGANLNWGKQGVVVVITASKNDLDKFSMCSWILKIFMKEIIMRMTSW